MPDVRIRVPPYVLCKILESRCAFLENMLSRVSWTEMRAPDVQDGGRRSALFACREGCHHPGACTNVACAWNGTRSRPLHRPLTILLAISSG